MRGRGIASLWRSRRLWSFVFLASFAFVLLIPLAPATKLGAYSQLSQTDWSGGVGTNTQNQYASKTGVVADTDLTLDDSGGAIAWCNTSACDTSWTRRQSVLLDIVPAAETNVNVQLTVQYKSAMRSSFDDLRFTSDTNDTDLPYYLIDKVDGQWASVLVQVPIQTGQTIFMYYGNAGANSTATDSILNLKSDFPTNTSTTATLDSWGGAGSGNNNLQNPKGVTVDSSGNVYVADSGNSRVVKYDSSGDFVDLIGEAGTGAGELNDPSQISIHPGNGNLYVIDQGNFVKVYSGSDGSYQFGFGSSGTGDGEMINPTGIAVCDSNSLYIVDNGNNRIQWWSTGGFFIASAGEYGTDYGKFDDPRMATCIPKDGGYQVGINDYGNNRIVIIGGDLTMNPGDIPFHQLGSYGTGNGQFDHPGAIAVDSTGKIFVSDGGNGRVQVFTSAGVFLSKWNSNAATLDIGPDNNIYVSDFANSTITKYAQPTLGDGWSSRWDYTVDSNGFVELRNHSNGWLTNSATWDRSKPRAIEYDVSVANDNYSCGDTPGFFEIDADVSYSEALYFTKPGQCDNSVPYYTASYLDHYPANTSSVVNNPKKLPFGSFVRIKQVAKVDGGSDYYISTDSGRSYEEVDVEDTTETGDVLARLRAWGGFLTVRSIISYDSVARVNNTAFSIEEFQGGYTGQIESPVYDLGTTGTMFGNVTIDTSGTGNVGLFARTGTTEAATGEYRYCGLISSGQALSTSRCGGENGARYVQYLLQMSSNSSNDFHVSAVSIEYLVDEEPPTSPQNLVMRNSDGGEIINDGGWARTIPYFSWDSVVDAESGTAGYCVYVGTDSNPDLSSTAGMIGGTSEINTNGACQYAITGTYLEIANQLNSSFSTGSTYYVILQALDNFGNLSTPTTSSFSYDNDLPQAGTLYNLPSAVNSKTITLTWLSQASFQDNGSGIAGYKYCVTSAITGFSGCDASSQNWYGANHTSGNPRDVSDVIPVSAGSLTTVPADFDRLDDSVAGVNAITMIILDNAGNVNGAYNMGIFLITHTASDAPNNLSVTPSSNTENSFSFTWDIPTTLYGSSSQTNYCWTVNVTIAADGSNCNLTGAGITQLAAGPYATQQGVNTFYIATKDITGNFDNTKVASITFTATTTAPGVPQNLELSDVSIRATSTWKLASSWSPPSQEGSGVASYRILRSTDDATYDEVGSTSSTNTSFVDSGLNQVLYYYKIKACDNAGNCSVPSTSASRRPTGRFTEPAKLTADTDQPREKDITTRKATLFWFTDRESDSKVSIGTTPGSYFPAEIGNSIQSSNHSVNLTNLQPGTRYYYVAHWTDSDGNTGTSQEHSFVTLPAPTFSEVSASEVSVSGAVINLTSLNASKVKLYYGKSEAFGAVKEIDTSSELSSYSMRLSELDDGSKYFYKLNGLDPEGNEYQGDIYSFTTPARPRISNLRISTVEGEPSSTKQVTWTTNVPTTSTATYTALNGKELAETSSTLTTEHTLTIRGLEDDTDYTLVATSRDSAGNTATSDTQTFHTALDTRPPKISDVSIETSVRGNGGQARGQIIVSWKTDEPATSQVAFGQGEGGDLTNRTAEDARLSLEHTVVVSDIPTSSIYQIRAVSGDRSGNSALSDPQTAIIGRASENVFTIIFTTLQKIFGIGN